MKPIRTNTLTKLTTVKIIKGEYSQFKKIAFDCDVTLQKLVNRCLHKYNTNEDFRNEINECTELETSGSQF